MVKLNQPLNEPILFDAFFSAREINVDCDQSTLVGLCTDPAPLIISNFFLFRVLWS